MSDVTDVADAVDDATPLSSTKALVERRFHEFAQERGVAGPDGRYDPDLARDKLKEPLLRTVSGSKREKDQRALTRGTANSIVWGEDFLVPHSAEWKEADEVTQAVYKRAWQSSWRLTDPKPSSPLSGWAREHEGAPVLVRAQVRASTGSDDYVQGCYLAGSLALVKEDGQAHMTTAIREAVERATEYTRVIVEKHPEYHKALSHELRKQMDALVLGVKADMLALEPGPNGAGPDVADDAE